MINLSMLPTESFSRYIAENKLFDPREAILIAVSGGRDSVLLAHLFNEANYKFGIAHCNFMLRGSESMADEVFTRQLAEKFNVPIHSTQFDTQAYADEHGISIQMAARDLRYEWLEMTRQRHDYHYIAVAHHQNDSIETVLLNLVRGTGIAGLHGIAPKRGKIIRPLLFLTRNEIDRTVNAAKITYRDDVSNFSSKYARNKLRIEVIPKLKELNPRLEETFEANRTRFSDMETILNQRVEEIRDQLFAIQPDNSIQLDISSIKGLTPLGTLLFELLKPYNFKQAVVGDLIRSLDSLPGKIFESQTHHILLDRGKLILTPLTESMMQEVVITENTHAGFWGSTPFTIRVSQSDAFQLIKDNSLTQLDAGLLMYPLKLRTWQNGDRFKPLGFYGEKKLSDLFISLKLPLTAKSGIGVLENGNGDIVCIPGIRIDERYKVTANTKKVFIFEWIKPHGNQANFY